VDIFWDLKRLAPDGSRCIRRQCAKLAEHPAVPYKAFVIRIPFRDTVSRKTGHRTPALDMEHRRCASRTVNAMTPLRFRQKSGPNGQLHLDILVGKADAECDVAVVVEPPARKVTVAFSSPTSPTLGAAGSLMGASFSMSA
jgi:hypothetical protein